MTTISVSSTIGISLTSPAYTSPVVIETGVTITNPSYPDAVYLAARIGCVLAALALSYLPVRAMWRAPLPRWVWLCLATLFGLACGLYMLGLVLPEDVLALLGASVGIVAFFAICVFAWSEAKQRIGTQIVLPGAFIPAGDRFHRIEPQLHGRVLHGEILPPN